MGERLEQAGNGLKVVLLTCAWIMVFAKLNMTWFSEIIGLFILQHKKLAYCYVMVNFINKQESEECIENCIFFCELNVKLYFNFTQS